MAVTPELYTLHAIARELGIDRRTLGQEMALLPPDSKDEKGRPLWLMRSVVPHLYRKPDELEAAEIDRRRKFADMEKSELEIALQKRRVVKIEELAKIIKELFIEVRTHTEMQLGLLPNTLTRHERSEYEDELRRHQRRLEERLRDYANRLGGSEEDDHGSDPSDPSSSEADSEPVGRKRKSPQRRGKRPNREMAEQ